ncbi:ABC transporter ATP-binding protein [Raineyella sp.]|uniref:ABC transporter ATP-binding protein n=1 Tax=Raineyella sp. TaxID=1911550 RepID=UPI002B1F7597|nr:ATP-binding cassette domain-containing protein [Raineyella sp.]MEA5154019.1 ATP-binding cassette domain-containing protein [Raineyella sp.]
MLHIDGLTKSYGRHILWSDLTRTVPSAAMTALTGPSGSGKSTLLNCIGLLDRPDSGDIRFDGRPLSGVSSHRARIFRRDTLGYLFQNYALIPDTTIKENLQVALPRLSRRESRARLADALAAVGLAGRAQEPTHHLSGGEQQRLALARLIVRKPALILADEPTGALDEDNATMVIGTLRQLAEAGATVLIATHNATVRDACGEQIDLTCTGHPDGPPPGPVPPGLSPTGRGRSRRPASVRVG